MELRHALDLCADARSDDWARIPGDRPATAIVAGLFDPGAAESDLRPLAGHSISVYAPDARLSLVWPVPDEYDEDWRQRGLPEWAERDAHEWKHARPGWAVILLSGSPIWQTIVWYLDWGSGIGGYVPDFRPRFGDEIEDGTPKLEGWEVSSWAVRLAGLINSFSHTGSDFARLDPTPRLVPSPTPVHPIDAQCGGY